METIGKYQVHKVLGHGGMGTVYEALDPVIQRKVALKTMIPALADAPELRLRFLREAQAAGGLRHRNIVTVYDLGEDKGRPYIAMEYIDGTDLEKIIQNREPLSLEWKLDVLRQVCEGLSYAHRHGIVHRDIKPANIRVTPDGEVKIMDFGIAHLQSSNLTKSGLVLGTVHYMSPEQIDGNKVDLRADVFSVGAIAYELFAYKRPFEAESITGVMYQIMHDRPGRQGAAHHAVLARAGAHHHEGHGAPGRGALPVAGGHAQRPGVAGARDRLEAGDAHARPRHGRTMPTRWPCRSTWRWRSAARS